MQNLIVITDQENQFINAYISAIYFTNCGDSDQPSYDSELDSDCRRDCIIDCLAFLRQSLPYLDCCMDFDQAGHDFWLTRNGHGTGFWDRPEIYGKYSSELLTKKSESFGCYDPYFIIEAKS